MTVGILQDIVTKVREVSGCGNSLQITDEKIIKYLNSYYLYDLPDDLRLLKLKDVYTFNTIQGLDAYPFDFDSWSTIEGPAYCAKREMTLFQNPIEFYTWNFNQQTIETFATGDGTAGVRSGNITDATQANPCNIESAGHGLQTGYEVLIQDVGGMVELNGNTYIITVVDVNNFTLNVDSTGFTAYTTGGTWTVFPYDGTTLDSPLIASVNNNPPQDTAIPNTSVFPAGYPPSTTFHNISRIQNILITANTATSSLHVTDDGNGNLIGDVIAGGTINYQTGVISNLTFSAVVPSGNEIKIQYIPVTLGRPNTILFTQQQFIIRPVPDQAYTIELTGYREPSQALLGTTSNTAPSLSGRPELFDWWELLAFGTAKKLYQDRLDTDGIQLMDAFINEKVSEARTRTYGQIGKRQISTIYRDETSSQSYWGWGVR